MEERQRLNRIARFERDMRRDLDSLATEEGLQLGLDFTQFDASTADLMQHLSPEDREMAQHLREIRDINREIGELGFARDHQAELEDFLAQAEERAALPLMFGTTDGLASRLPSLGAVAQTSNFGAFGSFSGSAISGFGMASPADRTANAVERIENLTQEQLDRATDANELLERILREGGGLVAF